MPENIILTRKSLCGLLLFSLSAFGQTALLGSDPRPAIKIITPYADGLVVNYTIGQPVPIVVTAQVQSSVGTAQFNLTQTGGSWLSVSPTSGTTPATLTISIDPTGLAVGTYQGSYTVSTTVTSNGTTYAGTDTSTITLTVNPAPVNNVSVQPGSLSFSGTQGQTVAPQNLLLTSASGSLNYTVTAPSAPWLTVTPSSGATGASGATIAVTASTAGLAVGTFNTSLTINVTGGTPSTVTVPVTFTVGAAPATTVNVLLQPASLTFAGTVGQPVAPQTVVLSSAPSSLNYTVTAPSVPWLSVTPSSGATGGTTGSAISLSVSTAGLTPGTLSTTLFVNVPGGTPGSFSLPVTFTVAAAPPTLLTSPALPLSLTFSYVQNSTNLPATQSFNLAAGSSNLAFTETTTQPWLNVVHTSTSGTLPDSETVSVIPGKLTPGTYTDTISYQVTGASPSSFTVPVTFTITAAPPPPVTVSPASLTFSAQFAGQAPSPTGITIQVPSGTGAINYTATANVPWLNIAPSSGAAPATIQVTPVISGLAVGTVNGNVTISVPGGNPASITVPVTLNVTATPPTIVSPSQINLTGTAGQPPSSSPASVLLQTASTQPVAYTVTAPVGAPWLIVTGSLSGTISSTTPAIINVSGDPTQGSLTAGTYSANITIVSAGLTSIVPVSFTVNPAPIPLQIDRSVLNSSAAAGGSPVSAGVVRLTTNPGNLAFTVNGLPIWLTVTPSSGTGSQSLSFTANPSQLGLGNYQAIVAITAGNSSVQVTVNLNVVAPNAPAFSLNPPSVAISQTLSLATQPPASTSVILNGLTNGTDYSLVQWTATTSVSSGGNWLSASAVNTASFPFSLTVYASSTGLTPGAYSGTVTVTGQAGTTVSASLPVTFTVTANNNSYTATPTTLQETAVAGSAPPVSDSITLAPAAPGLTFSATSNQTWLTITSQNGATMPGTVTFTADPSALTPGLYTGAITIVASAGPSTVITTPVQTVSVSFNVSAPAPPVPSATSGTTNFLASQVNQPLSLATVSITGNGSLQITAATTTPWLDLTSSSVTLGGSSPTSGVISAELNGAVIPAASGSYAGSFTLSTDAGGVFFTGSVALQVPASDTFQFSIVPAASSVNSAVNINSPLSLGTITIQNTNTSPLAFSISSNQPWLTVNPASGTVPASGNLNLVATVDQSAFTTAGNYNGTLTVHPTAASDTSQDQFYTVAIDVEPAATASASLDLEPPVHSGPDDGTTQIAYAITITNPTLSAQPYTAGVTSYDSLPLLSGKFDAASGTVAASSTLTLNLTATAPSTAGLSGGTAVINLGGTAFQSNYTYLGLPGLTYSSRTPGAFSAKASCAATSLYVVPTTPQQNAQARVGSPLAINVIVVDNCGNPLTTGNVQASFSTGDNSVVLTSVNSIGSWTGTWVPISTSSPSVSISINAQTGANGLTGTAKIQVGLNTTPIGPVVPPASVVSSADFSTPDSGSPGSILSIFGLNLASNTATLSGLPLPSTLLDTTVTLGTRQLDLFFVSPGQINAFVPYDFPPNTSPQLVVNRTGNNTASVPLTVFVNQAAPSLFLLSADPSRPGIVVDYRNGQPGFLVAAATPVKAGDILVLYALGLGAVTQNVGSAQPAPISPLPYTANPVTATIGGISAPVQYAGLTPTTVGLYQVNVQVPSGIQPGNQVPITITIDGQSSVPVTIPFAAQ